MTTVVLGWDALDYDLVSNHELGVAFGAKTTPLETFDNPILGKPHTYEVWPSIITGKPPDEHGIHAERYIEGGSWERPLLNIASMVSKYVVPERIRWAVGRKIRDTGAEFAFEDLDSYADRGVRTIFHGPQSSFALAIPNARSRYDDQLGIEMDRGAQLADFLDIETGEDGETVHTPSVGLETLALKLEADLGKKLGAVRAAIRWDFDLVFVWLGYLDTVGHVAPTVDDAESWCRDSYETAAEWTAFIHRDLDYDDTLICVSDHGLKDGEHTPDAFFGWNGHEDAQAPASVLEVASTIAQTLPEPERRDEPYSAISDGHEFAAVNERLRDLGYVE